MTSPPPTMLGLFERVHDDPEEELERIQALLLSYFDASAVPTQIYDARDGRHLGSNRASLNMHGLGDTLPPELADYNVLEDPMVAGTHFEQIFHDLAAGGERHIGRAVYNVSEAIDGLERTGKEIVTDVHTFGVRDASNRVRWVVGQHLDISQRVAVERERDRANEALQHAQRLDSLGVLAGSIAHDFNNILMAISAHAELASYNQEHDPDYVRSALEDIRFAADRAANLTHQLLDFARRNPPRRSAFDIHASISNFLPLFQRVLPATVSFQAELDAEPMHVRMDLSRLEQALLNLIVNAREAVSGQGNITLRLTRQVPPPQVQSDFKLDDGPHVRIDIIDDGVGMSEEVRSRMFEPFYTTREPGRGTGLGLSIVWSTMQSEEGGVEVQSTPGEGTTMTLWVPLHHGDRVEAPHVDVPLLDRATTLFRVLVVEDEPSIRRALVRSLASAGLRTVVCVDGVEAIDTFTRSPYDFDAVILDVIMPKLGGVDTALQMLELRPHLPIVFVTGDSHGNLERIDLERAERAVLQKPFGLHQLIGTVLQVIGR